MNHDTATRHAIASISPTDIAAYLASCGWKQIEFEADHSSTWQNTFEGEAVDLMLPLNRRFKDFSVRAEEVVLLLAAVEERPLLEVLSDLQTAGSDVIRVRFRHASAADGSIPLDQGEALIENAREMMLAGACAAVQPKAYYARRRPEEASRFVRGLRLGQTERGSYVLTVHSPVTPSLQTPLFGDPEPPFERRAVTQLARSLAALRKATDSTLTAPNADVFQNAIAAGVSGNLCSAVVGMNGENTQTMDELRFTFTFARSRPVDPETPREIVIPGDRIPLIQEASRFYRASAPPEESEIQGAVVQLRREEQSGPAAGPVTVMAFVDGKPRRVQITLDEAGHRVALLAYQQGAEIACTGDLVKQGNAWILQNPKGFSIVAGES
jgi:hypothetical protein